MGRGWPRTLLFVLLFVLLSTLVPYLVFRELGLGTLVFDTRLLSWPVLAAAAALLLVYFAADALRLYFALGALGYYVSLAAIWRLVFINILFSNVTPMASGGGIGQVWYLQRLGVPLGTAMAATTVRTLLGMLLIFIPAPFLLWWMNPLQGLLEGSKVGLYVALFAGGYIGFFALVLWKTIWLLFLTDKSVAVLQAAGVFGSRTRYAWRLRTGRELVRFRNGIKAFFGGPKTAVLYTVLATGVFLLALFSVPFLLLWALDYRVGFWTTVGLVELTTFFMYFAPTPGASGVAEGLFGVMFNSIIRPADLLLTVLAWRFLTIHSGMLIGAWVVLRMLARRGRDGD